MEDRVENQLNMVGACITVAEDQNNILTWTGKEPAAFGPELALVKTAYGEASALAAQAAAATGGAADAKALAETALEDVCFTLTRGMAFHARKSNNAELLGKTNLTRTAIVRLRDQALLAKGRELGALGITVATEVDASIRGVSPARLAQLTGCVTRYEQLLSKPRGEIVNRATLLRELKTRVAGLVEMVRALDDLVVQFDGTPEGQRFMQAWKQARMIIDAGHGPGEDEPPTPPAPTPPTA